MLSAIPTDIDPALLADFPALLPPDGVTSNFVNPYTLGPVLIIVGSILITVMMIFVLARIYTKTCIHRKVHWDDLTCVLATLGAIAYFVTSIYSVKGKEGTHGWNIKLLDFMSDRFLLPAFLALVLPPPLMLCTKTTLFLLYLQLFKIVKVLRLCIYAGLTITFGFYASVTVLQFYYETPRPGETFVSHQFGPLGSKTLTLAVPFSIFGVIIDFYILILPIVAVWRLQMAKKRKIGLCLMFGTGSIACISSVLSLYYRILRDGSIDSTWASFPTLLLALVEICVGVICSCMPSFYSMFRHHHPSFEMLKPHLLSRYHSFRRLLSGRRGGPESVPSDSESRNGCVMPYTSLESSPKSKSLPGLHSRLWQLDTLRTYIRGGHQNETSEEGIHVVTRDLEQA